MSTPMVPARPMPRKRPIVPKPQPDCKGQRTVRETAERTLGRWPARSRSLPGDILERAYLYVGLDGGLALDAGVRSKDNPRPEVGACPHDRTRGDPAPSPHFRIPVYDGPRSQITMAPNRGIRVDDRPCPDDATAPHRGDAREVGERMHGRKKLSPKAP